MRGKYRIFEDGVLKEEVENLITTEGKNLIRNYLAGTAGSWSGSIAIGALNSQAPSVSDSGLQFEIVRVPVTLSAVRGSDIILSADIEPETAGRIFELGVYPTVTNSFSAGFDDRTIASFAENWVDSSGVSLVSSKFDGTEDAPTARVGYRNLIVNNSAMDTNYSLGLNLSGYSDLDSLSILYKVTSTGTNKVVRITFYDDQLPTAGTRYFDFTLDGSTTGYKKTTEIFGNFTSTGGFNGNVANISITSASGSFAVVHLDAIKLDDADETNPNFALVSRALIGQVGGTASTDYFEKRAGVNMTIEYVVELS